MRGSKRGSSFTSTERAAVSISHSRSRIEPDVAEIPTAMSLGEGPRGPLRSFAIPPLAGLSPGLELKGSVLSLPHRFSPNFLLRCFSTLHVVSFVEKFPTTA